MAVSGSAAFGGTTPALDAFKDQSQTRSAAKLRAEPTRPFADHVAHANAPTPPKPAAPDGRSTEAKEAAPAAIDATAPSNPAPDATTASDVMDQASIATDTLATEAATDPSVLVEPALAADPIAPAAVPVIPPDLQTRSLEISFDPASANDGVDGSAIASPTATPDKAVAGQSELRATPAAVTDQDIGSLAPATPETKPGSTAKPNAADNPRHDRDALPSKADVDHAPKLIEVKAVLEPNASFAVMAKSSPPVAPPANPSLTSAEALVASDPASIGGQNSGTNPGANTAIAQPATAPTSPVPAALDAHALMALASRISKRTDAQGVKLDLRLDPPSLGNVQATLSFGKDGETRLSLAVEKPEAAAELMRQSRELERALQELGLSITADSIEVRLSEGDGRGFSDFHDENARARLAELAANKSNKDNGSDAISDADLSRTLSLTRYKRSRFDVLA